MKEELKILGLRLVQEKSYIANKVQEISLEEAGKGNASLVSKLQDSNMIEVRENFIGMFGKALIHGMDQKKAYVMIEDWAKESGEYAHRLGILLDEALKDTTYYRKFICETIEDEIVKRNMSVKTAFAASRVIDPLIDHAIYCFSLTYIHYYQKSLEDAKTKFLELSVPVVPIAQSIAILPLIGNIDEERAYLLMEKTLSEASRLKLSKLILDLSGVATVDTMVADQIFKVVSALRLLGVQTIVTGIRPEIAQTAVSLGLDFSGQLTRANLQQALSDLNVIQ
ncbi:STAS domain-containing protein [Bacillus massilinigeriensis]|uniref:STAS domain-containing protein n=1 Tax=Bacillus mediterraneensis TaxID=1805474 RepID=UPI0008F8450E|nr:STAS domain-containing protein [Bacillus mediterraneensis]